MNYAILAAGLGSRLVQEKLDLPKPLVDLDGTPMIKRLIDVFLRNDAQSLCIFVNEEMQQLRHYIESLDIPVPFKLIVKSTPTGMHSFYEVSRHFGSSKFCVATVDTVFDEQVFKEFIKAFDADTSYDGYMAVTPFIDDEKPLYVEVESNMVNTAFEDVQTGRATYVSGGIYCLQSSALEVLDDCLAKGISGLRDYQRALVAAGLKLYAYSFEKMIDVDHLHDIETANEFIKQLKGKS